MRLVAAIAALALASAGCGSAAPSATPPPSQAPANGGWSRIPIAPDPALAAAAYKLCVPDAGAKPGGGELPLIVQDQRGPGAAFLIWAANDTVTSCLAMEKNGTLQQIAGFGSSGRGLGGAVLDVWGRNATAPHAIAGDTGPGTHIFIQLADGSSFEASRGRGAFGAWWPQPVQAIAVRSVDDLGRLVETHPLNDPVGP